MTDGKHFAKPRQTAPIRQPVESLAFRVLDVLVSRTGRGPQAVDSDLLASFCDAIRGPGPEQQDFALALLRKARVPDEAIVDVYVPAAARLLGDEWCVDTTSFADVTIGTSRLQAMLRDVNEKLGEKQSVKSGCAVSALVVVPQDEYHTLGAVAVVGRLRRAGVSVRLCIGQSDGAMMDIAESANYDAAFVTVPQGEKLDVVAQLVIKLRMSLGYGVPLVAGGASLTHISEAELKNRTGVDHATNDLDEALRLCGLMASQHGSGRTERR
ncbi:cobalamin B12-binding domain-containing protein [Anianabacter salinae]|uniref:cobalamin B12-binding domain-containing protein n=1 Tax=Anianabacter salinae TaxID=2851023 RepID=UPI00225E1DB8|nr:hypothetical protein [Anianabacter salinae]MBV0914200.1 cobalamin B12-binding domain-containing protein [Anianabacter salinae]